VVHDVLRSPGRPLDAGVRAVMEPRFGHNFAHVRVHSDARAADSADALGAFAYTAGPHIVFGAGQYAPHTEGGRSLLAHELAHVVQQNRSSAVNAGPDDALEAEASQAAAGILHGQSSAIRHAAPRGSIQCARRTVRGRVFEVGDVLLNNLADTDVRTHGVLLPGPDQAHIVVTGDKRLGYEVSHTTPDDPFRWQHLKDIVDSASLDISGLSSTADFAVREVAPNVDQVVQRNLIFLGAGGITLPRLSQQRTINPTATTFVASADNARDKIFYDTGAQGRGLFGSNSLAHELFGHYWLAMRGVPYQHGRQLTAAHGISDPLGRPFAGDVNTYISNFAGASGTALQSPTQRVSTQFLNDALTWLMTNGPSGLTLSNNVGAASSDFGRNWEIVSQNYDILRVGPQGPAAPSLQSAVGVVNWFVGWYNTSLSLDQKRAFRSVLLGITTSFGSNRRTRLPQDVLNALPALPSTVNP